MGPNLPKNKGGRKPLPVEIAALDILKDYWLNPKSLETLRKRIEGKKYSLSDMFYFKCMSGNEKLLADAFKKLHPDNIDLTSGGRPLGSRTLTEEEQALVEAIFGKK